MPTKVFSSFCIETMYGKCALKIQSYIYRMLNNWVDYFEKNVESRLSKMLFFLNTYKILSVILYKYLGYFSKREIVQKRGPLSAIKYVFYMKS